MYTSEASGKGCRASTCPLLVFISLAALLGACAGTGDTSSDTSPQARVDGPAKPAADAQHYQLLAGESSVEIHVYRDGRLARLGHNHVIATTAIEGDLWLAPRIEESVVELTVDKASLTVDEAWRRQAAGEDFASEPTADAIAGTRSNMLGAALLNAAEFPSVALRTIAVRGELPTLTLLAELTVGDTPRPLALPLSVSRENGRLTATGRLSITHEELGLEPFSVMLGALRVREEMILSYAIVAQDTSG